jgi:hypothetical protein
MLDIQYGAVNVERMRRENPRIAAINTASRTSSLAGFAIGKYLSIETQTMKTTKGPTHARVDAFAFVASFAVLCEVTSSNELSG